MNSSVDDINSHIRFNSNRFNRYVSFKFKKLVGGDFISATNISVVGGCDKKVIVDKYNEFINNHSKGIVYAPDFKFKNFNKLTPRTNE